MGQQYNFYVIELNGTTFEIPQRYQNLSTIGVGAFGQVCSAFDTVLERNVAIKKVLKPFQTPIHSKRTYREIKLLLHMKHDNVIELIDFFTPARDPASLTDIYLVTELMGADLHNIIRFQQLTDEHVQFLVYQILRGLKYVHSAGIIHRDLKPSNIAVNENCDLKILDFGLARIADPEMTGYVATRWYRAPEIMLSWKKYDKAVDIWSVGCIFAELLTQKTLFPGTDHVNQLTLITDVVGTPSDAVIATIESETARNYVKSMPRSEKMPLDELLGPAASPLAVDLLEKMLIFDPAARITAEEALGHPYLAQFHDAADEPVSERFDDAFEGQDLSEVEWMSLVWDALRTSDKASFPI
eukprot:Nk52_evm14s2596 gene=Nk52_evmTU14s2596